MSKELEDAAAAALHKNKKIEGEKKVEGEKKEEIEKVVEEEIEVDLDGGAKVKLSKTEAAKVIANRTAKHQELKALKDKVSQIEAAEAKKLADAKAAEEAADHDKKLANGDVKAVIQANNAKWQAQVDAERGRLNKLGDNLLGSELKGKLAAMANLNVTEAAHQTIINDTLAVLRHQTKYNFDTGTIEVLDNTGSVMTDSDTGEGMSVDKFLTKFVAERPYIVQKKVATKIDVGGTKDGDKSKKALDKKATWAEAANALIKRR